MLIVIFLPGGIMEGVRRIGSADPPRRGGGSGGRRRASRRSRPVPRPQHRPPRRRRRQELRRPARALRHRPAGRGRHDPCHHRAERRRQVDAAQRLRRPASGPTAARSSSTAQTLDRPASRTRSTSSASAGSSRRPEIFADLSLLQNVMIPAFAKRDGAFRINVLAAVVDSERDIRDEASAMLEDVGLHEPPATPRPAACRAATSAGWSWRMCLIQQPRLLLLDEPTAGMSRHDTNTHDRAAQEDQGARHDQGHHRARHARRLLARRQDHASWRRAGSSPRARPTRSAAIRRCRKPISAEAQR